MLRNSCGAFFMSDSVVQYTRIDKDKWPYSPIFQDFADFLGLSAERDAKGMNWRHDQKTIDKIQKIYFWGMVKAQSNDHDKIKEIVYNLQRKVGVNWVGKTLIDRLWQHTIFDTSFKRQIEKLSKQIEANEQKEAKKIEEPVRIERPEKGIPASTKPIKKVKQEHQNFKNTMEIPEIKQKPM